MNNPFAHCISKSCDKYSSCIRALPNNNEQNIDYIRIDEGECNWYIEIVNEVEVVEDDIKEEGENDEG